jgi:hypothetical protein
MQPQIEFHQACLPELFYASIYLSFLLNIFFAVSWLIRSEVKVLNRGSLSGEKSSDR